MRRTDRQMEDLLSKEMTSSASDAASNQSRGQNALQRRALQLKRWTEWTQSEAEKAPKGGPQATPKVQFSSATLFLSAVAQNDVNECERLLRTTRDLNVNVTTGDGLTALHQMAIDDNLAMCRWLLDNGADANCKDNEGWTPLHASASCGHVEVVRLLLSRDDIDVFAINCDGELARDVCDGEQCLHAIEERMVAELRQRDDKTTLATTDDDSLIGEQVLRDLRNKELKQIERDFEAFLRETSAPSEHDFRAFLERTRDPASRATIVHVCAAKGYNECLCRVLEALAATECATDALLDSLRDSDGFTALHASAFWQQTHALETLLRFGASIDLKTADARELLDLCHENPKVAELLSETRRARAENADKPLKASETQRKLNAKRQRETRRPTQGVSKEDIELALKTTPSVLADDDCMTTATTDDTIETTTPPPMPSSPPPSAPSPPSDSAAAPEVPNGGQPTAPHAARRRPKRRSTGIEENLELNDLRGEPLAPSLGVDNDCTDSSTTTPTTTPTTRSRSSSRSSLQTTTDDSECETTTRTTPTTAATPVDDKDYKKLYKELLKENEFLLKKMKDFEGSRLKEREAQDFQREKRQLLRRIGELEEELRTKEELLKENARLKDENSALIRVISKLSK